MVYRWIQKKDEIFDSSIQSKRAATKKRLGAPGRRPIWYDNGVESALYEWIMNERNLHRIVTNEDAMERMLLLTHPIDPSFKASYSWLASFKKRFNLTSRKSTHFHVNETSTIGFNRKPFL